MDMAGSVGVRVSLSDWLAQRAKGRGAEGFRLLRDHPAGGAATVRRSMRGRRRWLVCAAMVVA